MMTATRTGSLRIATAAALLALAGSACSAEETPQGNGLGTAGSAGSGEGGGSGAAGSAGAQGDQPGTDATVSLWDKALFSFGTSNAQDVEVEFPAEGTYSSITLHLTLGCPAGGCDPWDRYATLGLVDPSEEDSVDNNLIELARFITPYGVGGSWDFDLTDLRPLLRGKQTLRCFISTWAKGWTVTATVEMKGGTPAKVPVFALPAWKLKYVVLGDPDKPIETAAPPASLTLPAGATSFALRATLTGHGQGNRDNCAEFCKQTHAFLVGGKRHESVLWRDDCAENPISNQTGTWKYPRAGWCPGADVRPWTFDVTADVSAAMLAGTEPLALDYRVGPTWENTCRPASKVCSGCVFGTSCEYNDSSHTEPYYKLSALLIGYR